MHSQVAKPVNVLVVALDEGLAEGLREMLELAGLPAQVTALPRAASLERAVVEHRAHVALISLDDDEGGAGGLTVERAGKTIPVIAVSSQPEPDAAADYVFATPQDRAGYMGIVAALKFYWMNAAPAPSVHPARSVRPKARVGVDMMALPIEPIEAYMLSFLDGEMSLDEIAQVLGTTSKRTRVMLRRLADLGAVSWSPSAPSVPPTSGRGSWSTFPAASDAGRAARAGSASSGWPFAPSSPPSVPAGRAAEASSLDAPGAGHRAASPPPRPSPDRVPALGAPRPIRRPAPPPPGPASTEEDGGRAPQPASPPLRSSAGSKPVSSPPASEADIGARGGPRSADAPPSASERGTPPARFDDTRRLAVDEAHAMIVAEVDHYELLGVPRNAPRGAIRTAYFALAKIFHTDTLFGEELGAYRRRMDRVFQAMTEAYETLSKKKKRQAYDAYLDALEETSALDFEDPPVGQRSAADGAPAAAVTSGRARGERPDAPSPAEPAAGASRTSARMRRQHLAARVAASVRGARQPKRDRKPSERPDPDSTVRTLARTLAMVSNASGGGDRVRRLRKDARRAEELGNLTGAATALRVALQWRPHDQELRSEARRLHEAAIAEKADVYEQRARYAAERARWDEAALCWGKVAAARPDDIEPARQAAAAILEGRGDLAAGARYARRVLEGAPDDASAHRLLGELFAAAGKPASARRSLRRAAELAPDDRVIRARLTELGD